MCKDEGSVGLVGSVHASLSGKDTQQTKDTVSRYRYTTRAVSFLGSPSTSVVAAATDFLDVPYVDKHVTQ